MCVFFEPLRSTSALIRKQKILFFCTSFIACLLLVSNTQAQVTWDGGAADDNWSSANNWNPNGVPTATDDVIIPNGFTTINIDVNAVCSSLTIDSGDEYTTVGITATNSLTVTNSVIIGAGTSPGGIGGFFADIQKILAVNAGVLNCTSITLTDPPANKDSRLTASTGTINVSEDIIMSGGNDDVAFTGAATLNIGGSFSGGVFTAATGTVNFIGNNQTILSEYDYFDLTVSGSGDAMVDGELNVGDDLTINSLGSVDFGAFTHTISGDWSNDNGTPNLSASTIILDGAAQAIGGTNSTSFDNLTLNGSGTKTFDLSTSIAGTLSIANGVVADLGTFTDHTTNALSLENVGQPGGTHGSSSSAAFYPNNTFFAGTSGVLTAAIDGPTTFYSRQTGDWNNATTWSTVIYGDATNVSGTYPQTGDIVNMGGGFTVTVTAAAECESITYQTGTGNTNLLSINTGITLDVSGHVYIPTNGETNTLAVGAGILTIGSLEFAPDFGDVSALTISTGVATIIGDISHTGPIFIVFPEAADITFTGGGLLQIGGIIDESFNYAFTSSTGEVEYYADSDQSIRDFSYYNLTLSGTGNKTATGALDINNDFYLSSGTTFTAGSFTHTVAGDWYQEGGTFNSAGSTISFDGTTQNIGGSQGTTFNNLNIAANSVTTFEYQTTINSTLNIAGTGGNEGVADLNDLTSHTATSLSFDGAGQVTGVWGTVASGAGNTSDAYFASNGTISVTNQIYYSRATGNWNTNTSWSTVDYSSGVNSGNVPVAGDIAKIGGGFTITVTADAACDIVEFESGVGNTNTLAINASNTLDVGEFVNIGSENNDTNILNVGAGTLNTVDLIFAPNYVFGGNATSELQISTGLVTVTGDVSHTGAEAFGVKQAAEITFSGAGSLEVAGDFLDASNCDFTASTGTVEYNGTEAQRVANFSYYNIILDNTSSTIPQLTAVGDINVSESLLMISGITDLDGNTFSMTGATSIMFRTASTTNNWFYNGTFSRFWPANTDIVSSGINKFGLFPLGKSTEMDYRPMEFNSTVQQTGAGTVSVTHTHRESVTELNPYYTDNDDDIEVKDNSSFEVTNTSTGGTYDVSVSMTDYGAGGDVSDIRLAKNEGSTSVSAVGTHAAASGTASEPTGNRTGVTSAELAGDWRITSVDIANTPLPVDLISFTGFLNDQQIRLAWSTASEINNDYFELERSYDGEYYQSITTISGNGNTNEITKYNFKDRDYHEGINYYRLKQVDFDGNFEIFEPIVISAQTTQQAQLTIYPNPSNSELHIRLDGIDNQSGSSMVISDHMGKIVYREPLSPATKQWSIENLNTILVPGIYLLNVQTGSSNLREKLVIQL